MTRTARPYGICQRSGLRFYLDELVNDGMYPEMLVHPKYWEAPERRRRYRPRPDEFFLKNPSLSNEVDKFVTNLPSYNSDTGEMMGAFQATASCGELSISLGSSYIELSDGEALFVADTEYLELAS